MLKQILIPVAAFAFTVTAASAFTGSDMLSKINVDLTDAQKSALEEAKNVRDQAQTKAQEILTNAGIDEAKMKEIHRAMREVHKEQHEKVEAAVEAGDYSAFTEAVKGSPLADTIDSEGEFKRLVDAHALRESGDREGAKEIMEELGVKGMGGKGGFGGGRGGRGMGEGGGVGM